MRGVNKMVIKNKVELINFVKKQTNVELVDVDINSRLSNKNTLYTKISRVNHNSILGLFIKYGIKYENHVQDYYWVYICKKGA